MNAAALATQMFEAGRAARWRRDDCFSRWPIVLATLEATGVLKVVEVSTTAICATCGDEHEVQHGDTPSAWCPLLGRFEVSANHIALLAFDQGAWLKAIGRALQLNSPSEVIGDALWKFETAQSAGWRKEIWIARDLMSPPTFDRVARHLRSAGRRQRWLLTSGEMPLESGAAFGAQLIRIAECATFEAGELQIEIEHVVGARKKIGKGTPGRRRKVDPAIALFRKRVHDGSLAKSVAEEARQIASELRSGLNPSERPSPRTIEDAIRDEHARAVGRHRGAKPA